MRFFPRKAPVVVREYHGCFRGARRFEKDARKMAGQGYSIRIANIHRDGNDRVCVVTYVMEEPR